MKKEEVIKINIPAGVSEGMQVKMSGKGNAARRGGINGDLIVLIQEEQHPELTRDGSDLLYNLYLSIPQATLGCHRGNSHSGRKGQDQNRGGNPAR